VSTTPVAKLLLVLLIPVVNLWQFATGINNTSCISGKFAAGVVLEKIINDPDAIIRGWWGRRFTK
jgi:hypothetical protein